MLRKPAAASTKCLRARVGLEAQGVVGLGQSGRNSAPMTPTSEITPMTRKAQTHQGSVERRCGLGQGRRSIAGEQRVVVRAEDGRRRGRAGPRPAGPPRRARSPATVAHQDVVQHQPRQRMEGVAPAAAAPGGTPRAKPASSQQAPGALAPAAAQVEVGAQHDGGPPEPLRAGSRPVGPGRPRRAIVARRARGDRDGRSPARIGRPASVECRGERHPALEHQRQLERARGVRAAASEGWRCPGRCGSAPFRIEGT